MEFSDLQKIWDQQNEQTLYAINETTLHHQVRRKIAKSDKTVNLLELAYIAISFFCVLVFMINSSRRFFVYVSIFSLLAIAAVIFLARSKRLRKAKTFDQSIQGNLDAAISNQRYLLKAGKYFLFWYILPLALPAIANMYTAEKIIPLWQWLFVVISFVVGYLTIALSAMPGLRRKVRRLEGLRALLDPGKANDADLI